MPLPHRLPGTIPVGEISPRDSGAVPVDDALSNAAAITKRAAFTALIRWQKGVNSLPLCIRELRKSRPLGHTSIMLEHRPTIRRHALGSSGAKGDEGCFYAVARFSLPQDRGNVHLDGAGSEVQRFRDLSVRLSLAEPDQDLSLASREAFEA